MTRPPFRPNRCHDGNHEHRHEHREHQAAASALACGRLRSANTRCAILLPSISSAGTADHLRNDILAERADKHHDRRREDAATHARARRPWIKGRQGPAPRSRAASSRMEIKLLRRGVERQDGKGQLRVDRAPAAPRRRCSAAWCPRTTMQADQQLRERPFGMQQRFPGKDADDEVREKRNDDEQQQKLPHTRPDAGHLKSHGQCERQTDQRGRRR
jgi:hypothetical protein